MTVSSDAQIIDGVLLIPQGVTEVDDGEFFGRTDFTKVVFPDTLKRIRGRAFYDCTNLTEIVLPDSLRNIENNAFRNCGLRALTLPPGVKSVAGAFGGGAFADCSALEKLTVLGERVQFKPHWGAVFENCPNLKDVQIPLKVWKRNYRKQKWTELYFIPPLGGLPSVDIFRLLLEDRIRRFLNKIAAADSMSLPGPKPSVHANILQQRFDAAHKGDIYTLAISLSGDTAPQQVTGFAIDVLFCQGRLELVDITPSKDLTGSYPDLILNGRGSYRINDNFKLKPQQTITRKYTVAHRPWPPDQPIAEHHPAVLALYCFRLRPLFAGPDGSEQAGPWSPRYVCALGSGYGYNFCLDIDYSYTSDLAQFFEVAAGCFLRLGLPLGKELMYLHTLALEDQNLLAEIALRDPSAWVRRTAVEKLESRPVLKKCARDPDWDVRTMAGERLIALAHHEKQL